MKNLFSRTKALFLALENKFVLKQTQPFFGNYAAITIQNPTFERKRISLGELIAEHIPNDFRIKAAKIVSKNIHQLFECIEIFNTLECQLDYRFTPIAHETETATELKIATMDLSVDFWKVDYRLHEHDLQFTLDPQTNIQMILWSNDFERIYNF